MKNHERADIREYVDGLEQNLLKLVAKAKKNALAAFEKEWADAKDGKAKAAKESAKEAEKVKEKAAKEAEKAAKDQPKEKEPKEPKKKQKE